MQCTSYQLDAIPILIRKLNNTAIWYYRTTIITRNGDLDLAIKRTCHVLK